MVVPDHRERELRVRCLQIGIEFVQRVPQAVGGEIDRLPLEPFGRRDAATSRRPNRVLIGVVAEMKHEIEVVSDHVAVGRVVAARPVLAGRESKLHLSRELMACRRGAEMSDGALFAAGVELVEVIAAGLEALDLDMNGVRERGRRQRHTARGHVLHAAVVSDAPPDGYRFPAEARGFGRVRRQPGPEHDAVGGRITRSHPERERIVAEPAGGEQVAPRYERQRQARGHAGPGVTQELSAIDGGRQCFRAAHEGPSFRGSETSHDR